MATEPWRQPKWLANQQQTQEIVRRTSDAELTAARALIVAMFALASVLTLALAQLAIFLWYLG